MDEREMRAIEYLQNDFTQCFEQMRHYDNQIYDIFKYLAGFYVTTTSLSIGLYQYSSDKNLDLMLPLSIGLLVALVFGIFSFCLIIRNRAYFVGCTRYINEQRSMFLAFKPLGFENKCGMFTDRTKPPYFHYRSSQAWWMYIVALSNSFLLGIVFYFIGNGRCCITLGILLVLFLQLFLGIKYFAAKDHKSVMAAIFGEVTEGKVAQASHSDE